METPRKIVDLMVERLFEGRPPHRNSQVLDPGCGTGAFVEGIIRWCRANRVKVPEIAGVEVDPHLASMARGQFDEYPTVHIEERDFLAPDGRRFDYVIGNPPYVPITELTEEEKERYRALKYKTAKRRFDLYLLFWEQALRVLQPGGRLVLITPEKFLYVETAGPLRELLASREVEEIHLLEEDTFGELVTYPTITVVSNYEGPSQTRVVTRDGLTLRVSLPQTSESWLPFLNGVVEVSSKHCLEDACLRVSCGVATGADAVFVRQEEELNEDLRPYAYPTIAGRELKPENRDLHTEYVMLIPYDRKGKLRKPEEIAPLIGYLSDPDRKARLLKRTCVRRKPWYAFHETPPLPAILQPKILCKDITAQPDFWVDRKGGIVPRHSVYYIVPKNPSMLDKLAEYLKTERVQGWLEARCQRAANGFLRLQSTTLKRLPIPGLFLERGIPGADE